jgi:hypothetical protein
VSLSFIFFDEFFSNIKSELYNHYSTKSPTTISSELLKYVYLSLSFNNYIFFLLLLLHRYSFEKIGDKKELDIKFDDFLHRPYFFGFIKKRNQETN